jgi:hypothetical protein
MKKLTILLLVTMLLLGCGNDNAKFDCTKGTIKILNKERSACARGDGGCYFTFYLYDGREAYTCNTDETTWNSYNINDTLPTLVIIKTITIKK